MDKNYDESKMRKKKRLITFGCVAAAVILCAVAILNLTSASGEFNVVTNISAKAESDDEIELKISYVYPTGRYSVREVTEEEGEYIGDGMIDYDGSLGKYRIMVSFGDVELSTALMMKFAINDVVEIKTSAAELKATVAHPSDHGFVLYIYSDTPLSVESVKGGELDMVGGTIIVPITIG